MYDQYLSGLVRCPVDMLNNFVVICMALFGQEHILRLILLTDEQVTI